jgi:hypothetical protein
MITERRPQVSPFSDVEFIAIWHVRDVHFPTITRPHPAAALRRAVRDAYRQRLADSDSERLRTGEVSGPSNCQI